MATPTPPISDPRNAHIASGKRDVQITAQQVQPPSPLYIQPEDNFTLIIAAPTNATAVTPVLTCRWLRSDGEIVTITKVLPKSVGGWTLTFTLGEGFLLSATVKIYDLLIPEPGAFFAWFTIQRDLPDVIGASFLLFADYITYSHLPSWPYGRQTCAQEGAGRIRSITGTTPGAGAEILETVPAGVRWRLLAFRTVLTTSVTVANRIVSFNVDDGANIFYNYFTNQLIPASSANKINVANMGWQGVLDSNDSFIPLPENFLLGQNFRLRTITNLLQAGDQYSAPQYLVQEWVSQ